MGRINRARVDNGHRPGAIIDNPGVGAGPGERARVVGQHSIDPQMPPSWSLTIRASYDLGESGTLSA